MGQRNLKILAAQADARWAAKPSFLDAPERSQPVPALESKDSGGAGDLDGALGAREQTTANIMEGQGDSAEKMQTPDGIRHRFNERSEQGRRGRGTRTRRKRI